MNLLAREVLDVLFASVWQGVFIALAIAAALALAGRRLNAATRYIILQGALVAIALVPLVTTVPNTMPHAVVRGRPATGPSAPIEAATGFIAVARRIDVPLSDRAVFVLTAGWLTGVLAFTLRIVASSLQLARLRRRSKRLADRGCVRVYASPDIRVPLAIGFAVPSIIVPTALAAEGDEQYECIMLHELAHVRRGDAWANAYERLLHAFLFFNPAVLVMTRAIALEREAACDDRAVAESRDLGTYTQSLASFAVWGAEAASVAACGASEFGRATVTRIQRLEDARHNGAVTLSHYALGGFTVVLIILALALASFTPAIAFGPQTSVTPAIVASTACSQLVRYVGGPPPKAFLPPGLKAQVLVRVSPAGKVMGASTFKPSGSAGFDAAALAAAKKGSYSSELRDCKPVAGTYIFEADTER